jgi:hypothetical protein
VAGPTTNWDYHNPEAYSVKVLPGKSAVALISAEDAGLTVSYSGNFGFSLQPVYSGIPGETVLKSLQMNFPDFPARRRDDGSGVILALENFAGRQIASLARFAGDYSHITLHAKAEKEPVQIEIALISRQGGVYCAKTTLSSTQETQRIPLKDLKPGKMMLLPRPYPGFLPFWHTPSKQADFDLSQIERIQFIIPKEGNSESPALEIKSISLE